MVSWSDMFVSVSDALVRMGVKKEDWVKREETLPVKSQEVACIQRGVGGELEEEELSVSNIDTRSFDDPLHKRL